MFNLKFNTNFNFQAFIIEKFNMKIDFFSTMRNLILLKSEIYMKWNIKNLYVQVISIWYLAKYTL